ncbi:MAG TPA: hypothetical protein VGK29_03875 [Paludibaculum sp.]|jgi:hypothetical protein
MNYYPIQETGAAAQFPVVRTRRWQTLETCTPGGHVARGVQPETRRVHWQLDYVDLSDAEASALMDLFEQSKGGLKSFEFVDPLENLLRGSEALEQGHWLVSGGVTVAESGASSPAEFQVTNSGQAAGTVGQTLALPGGGNFCLSCWIKGGAGTTASLRIGGHTRQVKTNGAWQRVWLTAPSESTGNTFCALELGAGVAVGLHSMQLEQQAAPSGYRAGTANGGIYPETRFEQESLDVMATGPNRNAVRVKLVSRLTE